jgi:hypothetical protein
MKLKNVCFAVAILFCVSTAQAQVTGSGTKNAIPVWTGTTSLGNSSISQASGNVGIGTTTPAAKLHVVNKSTTQAAIKGVNKATTGATDGIFGSTASTTAGANGVVGAATANTGVVVGVVGTSASTSGVGMVASATAATGLTTGLFSESLSPTGIGVEGVSPGGQNTAAGGAVVGVSADCSSTCINTPGNAGIFVTASGGNILVGAVALTGGWSRVFRVDSTGKGFFDGGTQTGGADFAESVAVAKEFTRQDEPGDLLIVDTSGNRQLKLSREPYSTLVAGIYSTKPGVLATPHRMDETPSNEIPLAIVGIVPCKVSAENGPIQPGDLLVSSSTPGHAMKGTDRSRMLGAVVGKALEPLRDGKGTIQVLVTLQ